MLRLVDRPLPAPPARRQANILLGSLDSDDLAALRPHLQRIALAAGARIAASDSPRARVCFPETLVASFGELMDDSRYEIGMIGCEGMIGWPVLLGSAHPPSCGIVQLSGGSALVLPADTLVRLCATRPRLQTALLRFVQSFTVQMAHTIIANQRDGVERRLARWLLMLHDRVKGDVLHVTHAALADALKVRRASVTDCLHLVEGDRIVRCTRGETIIRDRPALEALAGDAYGAAERSYSSLIAPFGKGASA